MRPHGEDVISVLTQDHRELQDMFDDLQLAATAGEKRRRADAVTVALVRHSVAEERYLYPAARRLVPDGESLADREIGDHAEVEKLLGRIGRTDARDPDFDRLVTALVRDVLEHVQDEESSLLPRLARHAGPGELAELGRLVRSVGTGMPAGPRPSPSARPSRRPAADGRPDSGSGLVDRVRDHLSGRP
ncbi:hemerythrin domain-containing protein [Actinomadura vinacea]|uniref:Hemerythrin domain-containing protein n=1 Tax=Actinomadura vinacea TaxID=115336 RepID=A0ABN3IMJ8_9ACTN